MEMIGQGVIVFLLAILPIVAVAIYLTSPGSEKEKEQVVLVLYLLSCINWASYVLFRWTAIMETRRLEMKGAEDVGGEKGVYVIGPM